MSRRTSVLAVVALVVVATAVLLLVQGPGAAPLVGPAPAGPASGADPGDGRAAALGGEDAARRTAAGPGGRAEVGPARASGGSVRGIVLDAATLQPLPGVEVRAMREPPGLERLISRFRTAFFEGGGFFTAPERPPRVLATALTLGDGTFVLDGLEPGVAFLDARADFTFVRSPLQVRIAAGEVRSGVELLGSPGGRIRGTVRDPGGVPLAGVVVSARPGLNAFLGQLTQQRYRWLEARTDADGEFDLPGVPEGPGYAVSAAGPEIALEEVFGVTVRAGQVTRVDLSGHPGATVRGQVFGPDGRPVPEANIALVYLDLSRVLFSADGRAEPITTDGDGRFAVERLAAGRIGFLAAADGMASSAVVDLTVVDGGLYEGIELRIEDGATLRGLVVDDQDRPLADALVELRPFERPDDPDVLKMALKVRNVTARSGADGRFTARGLSGERLFAQISKPGFVTEVKFGLRLDEPDLRIVLTRGVTVRGQVSGADGAPIARFAVDTRSRPVRPPAADGEAAEPVVEEPRRGPPWMRGGARGEGGMRLAAGQRIGDQGFGGDWREIQDADGRFELVGIPPGEIRVRVRAPGHRDPEAVTVTLEPGAVGDEIAFRLEEGAIARGTVVDLQTRGPVAGATVTAYRARGEDEGGGGPFRMSFDPEDFDFLGIAQGSRRSATTDSSGRFELVGLAGGRYRFTARHPDRAKASTDSEVTIAAEAPTEGIVIEFDEGGVIEGRVSGAGGIPLRDALVVAASLQAGSLESASSAEDGSYRIEGLSPGQYVVFKSRIDERAPNLGYDLLGNMRLKTVTVRRGKVTRLDIADEAEGTVRVFGQVRDGGTPVPRAMVTALGADREGLLGMGIRAQPTDQEGRFELIGLQPGQYFFQVTRFAGRPQQANLSIEVPEGIREYRVDLELPQSSIAGRVVDSRGDPVPRIQVSAGVEDGGVDDAPGLLGLLMRNGVAQTRTAEDGSFVLDKVAAGTYRIVASGRGFGRGGRDATFGEAVLEGIEVDGTLPVEGLLVVLPRAGLVTGAVVDGSGNPVRGAEIVASRDGAPRGLDSGEQMLDLIGVQARPVRTGADGRFELGGLTPGTYRVRADVEGLAPGVAEDVVVVEDGQVEVAIRVVVGATLRVRARNVDGSQIPPARISVLDGQGRPLASRVSVLSVFRRMVGSGERKVGDSGWYEVGSVPPDTYTILIEEPGEPEVRVTRTIRDGETVEWDVDVGAELQRQGRGR
jgi:protocatechuate 3,4-dioxygenase beta subunit